MSLYLLLYRLSSEWGWWLSCGDLNETEKVGATGQGNIHWGWEGWCRGGQLLTLLVMQYYTFFTALCKAATSNWSWGRINWCMIHTQTVVTWSRHITGTHYVMVIRYVFIRHAHKGGGHQIYLVDVTCQRNIMSSVLLRLLVFSFLLLLSEADNIDPACRYALTHNDSYHHLSSYLGYVRWASSMISHSLIADDYSQIMWYTCIV